MVVEYGYIAEYTPLCQIDGHAEMVIFTIENRIHVQTEMGVLLCRDESIN